MIEKVLEAYEAQKLSNKTFKNKLTNMNLIMKIVLGIVLASGVVTFLLAVFVPSQETLIAMIFYVCFLYILTLFFENQGHKKWKRNIIEYNQDLNTIREILKSTDFDLYEKNKIKQLICKYYQSIERLSAEESKKSIEIKEFICTYIIAPIAFFAGKINVSNSTNDEWIVMGLVFIFVVVCGKQAWSSIKEMVKMIGWNEMEKKKYFVLKLQDLLDGDFEIEEKDIISFK